MQPELEIVDAGDTVWRFDRTFLESNWTCIWGRGCLGILDEPAEHLGQGCCSVGAELADEDEARLISALGAMLDPERFEHHAAAADGLFADDAATNTRVVDGACIFLNRPGFAGGAGCALHQQAVRTGRAPHTAKPDVCWQLPLRRTYRTVDLPDETSYLEVTIGEYDRRAWGPGGHDLDWYCSGNPAAHVGREPVYRSLKAELVELMGQEGYDDLVLRCEAHLLNVRLVRSRGARHLLPMLIHPATVQANEKRARKR